MNRTTDRSRRPDDEVDEASAVGLRRFLSVFGVFVVAAGFVVLLSPDVGRSLSVQYLVVMGVGVLLIAFGARRWFKRLLSSVETVRTPPVERRTTVSVPGADFDALLAEDAQNAMGRLQVKTTAQDRIRTAAETVLEGDAGAAEEQLSAGSWSDDPDAVALFTDEPTSVRERVSSFVSGTSILQRPSAARSRPWDASQTRTSRGTNRRPTPNEPNRPTRPPTRPTAGTDSPRSR